jgi:hypothetical protein
MRARIAPLALGDHARQVDLDALKKKLEAEQQVAAGERWNP